MYEEASVFKAKIIGAAVVLLAILSFIAVTGFGSAKAEAGSKTLSGSSQAENRSAVANILPSSGRLKVGISYGDSLMWSSDQELAAALDDAVKLGVGWVRLDLAWGDIQPDNAYTYDWSKFDKIVSAAQARGLSLLPIISYTPEWARPAGGDSDMYAPANPAQFAAFAAAAAQRYAPKGIHTWEIWNEPNIRAFWMPAPSPSRYAKLLRLTAAAIRRRDPSAFIVMGGLASSDTVDGDISQLDFLTQVSALGANQVVDAIGYHPYSYPVPASNDIEWNAWSKISSNTVSIRSVLKKYGTPNLPIWVTEYGAPTNGPGVGATINDYKISSHPDHVDEAYQALMATDSVNEAQVTPNVSALFWYTNRDLGTDTSDVQNFFGLRRADGTAKPAFFALRAAIKSMNLAYRARAKAGAKK